MIVDSDIAEIEQVLASVSQGDELKARMFEIGDEPEQIQFPFSFTIAPSGALETERTVVVSAEVGEAILSARATVSFVSGRRPALRMFLSRSCVDVTCATTMTCLSGSCVEANINAAGLPDYEPGDEMRDAGSDASIDTALDVPSDVSSDVPDVSPDTGAPCVDGTVDLNGDPSDGCECVIAAELCDGFDNDCDPSTLDGADDMEVGSDCDGDDTDTDLCERGTIVCRDSEIVCDDMSVSSPEVCDGLDNDCNPATADGASDPQVGERCDGTDADECNEGVFSCGAGVLQCSDMTDDDVDRCNGEDDDCDGRTDEDALTREFCNGRDDDCDMRVDEGVDCGAGCERYTNSFGVYQICSDRRDRDDAQSFCTMRGYRLAKLETRTEHERLRTETSGVSDRWWIGLHDRGMEDMFEWTDGSPVTFSAWGSGQPNNTGGVEHCVAIDHAISAGHWNDNRCSERFRFICETRE